jgi:cytochrome c oxidase assembly factor CtaG
LLSNEVLVWFGKNIRSYILMIIFGTLIATSLQPDLLAATEKDLASHMVLEHTLFFFLGAISVQVAETVLRLIVSFENTKRKSRSQTGAQGRKSNLTLKIISVWSQSLRKIFIVNSRYGFIWLIIPIILLTFWHLPSIFDYATLNEQVHIIQHISFIIVGATAFLALRALGESFKILILVSLNAIMAFAGLMFAVTSTPIYPVYSVSSHNDAGTYMLITCILLLLVVLPTYLIHRTILHVRVKTINNSNRWQQGLE